MRSDGTAVGAAAAKNLADQGARDDRSVPFSSLVVGEGFARDDAHLAKCNWLGHGRVGRPGAQ